MACFTLLQLCINSDTNSREQCHSSRPVLMKPNSYLEHDGVENNKRVISNSLRDIFQHEESYFEF